jgi:hypothetical protein
MVDNKRLVVLMGVFVVGVFVFSLISVGMRFTGFVVYEDIGGGQTVATFESSDIIGDAYVISGNPNTNFGSDDELHLSAGTGRRYSYLSFNVSGIPVDQVIDGSELCLYLFTDVAQILNDYVHHVYVGFNESVLTWNNQPCGTGFDDSGSCNLTAVDSVVTDGSQDGSWQCFDVAGSLGYEYYNDNESVAFVLYTADGSSSYDRFYSKEYVNVSLRPYLNVTYHAANVAPVVVLDSPEGRLYTSNESLALNYSIVDDNLDSCWYNVGDGNVSIPGCGNLSFDVAGNGNYNLTIYVNDSFGVEASDSVSFSVDLEGVSVGVSEPVGEKSSRTGIGIVYSVSGADDCWYNVETSIGGSVVENTSLENCSGSSFDVSADGDYVLNLFGNNSLGGFGFDSSGFSVDSSGVVVIPPSTGGGSSGGGGSFAVSARLEVDSVDVIMSLGEEKSLLVNVKNSGGTSANKCSLSGGDFIDSSDIYNIGVGEIVEFEFVLRALDGVEGLEFSVECLDNVSGVVPLSVEVLKPSLDVSILGIGFDSGEELRIDYSVEPTGNLVSVLYFRILDSDENVVSEIVEEVELFLGEVYEGSVVLDIVDVSEGMLRVAISDGEVSFVEEDFVYGGGAGMTGFASLSWDGDFSYIGIVLIVFAMLAGLLIRRIWKLRKTLKGKR